MCDALLVGFEPEDEATLKQLFSDVFFNVTLLPDQATAKTAYRLAQHHAIDLLLLNLGSDPTDTIFDYKMNILGIQPNVKVILFDDQPNYDRLLTALRCGAIDYLVKPLDLKLCKTAIHRAILALNQVSLLDYHRVSVTDTSKESAHQMMQYIHQNYDKEITLETLATFMHLNKSYVSRTFKEVVGTTYSHYLRRYRIDRAKEWLKNPNHTITDVAQAVGYPDIAYFSRLFRKETGMAPSVFKQKAAGAIPPAAISSLPKNASQH
jgi:YesN/AraC family two-component response regulator